MSAPWRPAETIAFATYRAQKHEPLQVDVQDMVPVALRHFEERDAGKHSGVVDQNVDRAEPFLGGRNHRPHLLQLPQICLDQHRSPSARVYRIGNPLGGAVVIEPVDRDVGPNRGKFQCHSATDPLLRPRDQNHFAGQLHVSVPLIRVQTETCRPISTTASGGSLKYSVRWAELRCMKANNASATRGKALSSMSGTTVS